MTARSQLRCICEQLTAVLVHFKYEGDDVLTVKVFDGTMCRKYYYSDDEDTDDESDDDVKPCIHPL